MSELEEGIAAFIAKKKAREERDARMAALAQDVKRSLQKRHDDLVRAFENARTVINAFVAKSNALLAEESVSVRVEFTSPTNGGVGNISFTVSVLEGVSPGKAVINVHPDGRAQVFCNNAKAYDFQFLGASSDDFENVLLLLLRTEVLG